MLDLMLLEELDSAHVHSVAHCDDKADEVLPFAHRLSFTASSHRPLRSRVDSNF